MVQRIEPEHIRSGAAVGDIPVLEDVGGSPGFASGIDGSNLSGVIPAGHNGSHENGGLDEINVGGLSGALADPQTPATHGPTHHAGASDSLPTLARYAWAFDVGTADADPGTGEFRLNNVVPAIATFVYISINGYPGLGGTDFTQHLLNMRSGDRFFFVGSGGVAFVYRLTGTPISGGLYIKLPVAAVVTSGSPPLAAEVQEFRFHMMGPRTTRIGFDHQATTTSPTYQVLNRIIFAGSSFYGAIPASIKAIAFMTGATSYSIRVVDLTNGGLVVAEQTGLVNTTPAIIDLGAITNIPAGDAIFEVQMLRVGSGGQAADVQAIEFRF